MNLKRASLLEWMWHANEECVFTESRRMEKDTVVFQDFYTEVFPADLEV